MSFHLRAASCPSWQPKRWESRERKVSLSDSPTKFKPEPGNICVIHRETMRVNRDFSSSWSHLSNSAASLQAGGDQP